MSMLERFARFVGDTTPEATQALHICYLDAVSRARLLRRHAEMAPQLYSQEALRRLASAEEAQAERLCQALLAAGAAASSSVAGEPPPSVSLNHWGRLVQDLEAHRVAFRRLRELAVQFAECLPSTADLFDQLCRDERHHCEQIRALIARADPQALD